MHLADPISNGTDANKTNRVQHIKQASKYISPVSYPSRSLRFLQRLKAPFANEDGSSFISSARQAKLKLNIIIVGAGLGGLATSIALSRRGHKVIVLEQAHQLGEVCIPCYD